jgi:antitoxin (DNA-binding transcriptional repressor) of toxin-antitoxin stability system
MMVTIDWRQANLEELLKLLQDETEIVLVKDDKPIARITPLEPEAPILRRRIPDLQPGAWMSDDFNDPL